MPCLELPCADAQGSADTVGSIGEGSWPGGCGEGAVTRAEVLFLCPSRSASSQTPAMSRTPLLLLLLLRSLATGRPPPAATPRLKLSFPGERGARAGWGAWGQLWVHWLRLSSTQHHPEGREYPGRQCGGRGAKPQHWHVPSTAASLPAGSQVLVLVIRVPYVMPAPPGPPACPWGQACAWDLPPSPRHVLVQMPVSLCAAW